MLDKSSISASFSKSPSNQNMRQIHLKSSNRKNEVQTLWVQSPCTLSFSSKLPPLQQAKRFQYNSIYYRDNPFAPANKVDELQKPDLVLSQFRRQIRDTQNWVKRNKKLAKQKKSKGHLKKLSSNHNPRELSHENSISIQRKQISISPNSKQNMQTVIIERLYPRSPKKLKLEYDKYGNRSSFYADQQIACQKKTNKVFSNLIKIKKGHGTKYSTLTATESMFTESFRFDLSKPENFNPGPGSYFQVYKSHKKTLQKNISENNQKRKQKQTSQIKAIEKSKKSNMTYKNNISTLKSRKSLLEDDLNRFSDKLITTQNSIQQGQI